MEGTVLMIGINVHIKETLRSLLPLMPCEDTVRCPSMSQEVGLHQTLNLLAP